MAGILYMRNKLQAEIGDRREELARTLEDLRRAVRRSEDDGDRDSRPPPLGEEVDERSRRRERTTCPR